MRILTKGQNSQKIFALMYGESGTGKTHFAATLGELSAGRTLIIDIDQGSQTIWNAKDLQTPAIDNSVTIVSFDAFRDLNDAYQLIKKNDPKEWNKIFSSKNVPGASFNITEPFDWIVWDTWSELQFYMLQELRSKEADLKGSGNLEFRKNIGIQHWGMMTDLNKFAVEQLRDCKVNQLFIMQETMTKDDLSGQITGGPAIHGKLVQEMPAYFDVVIHTTTNLQGAFVASTLRKGKWPAKTRLREGKEYVNPRANQIFG